MAQRAAGYLRSMSQQNRHSATRSFSTSAEAKAQKLWLGKPMLDWAPIGITMGFVALASAFAVRTGYQHFMHNPGVVVTKKKRGMMSEVDQPMEAVTSGEKYVDRSLLRKIAHIQDDSNPTMPNAQQGSVNIYTRSRSHETLASLKQD